MSGKREDVEFRTIDGLTLRGWLYPTASRAPAVIITPGLPCVKEMFVPEVAEYFQAAGINALVYDPRSLGESDGEPRHEIDPAKQASDYSDALTFLLTRPTVDPKRISFWGMSFSGTIALCAAALDQRAHCCIVACPYVDLKPAPNRIAPVLAKVMKDRQSRGVGNAPTYIPMLTAFGTNPAGLHMQLTDEEMELVSTAKQRIPNFDTKTTVETYYNFFRWSPEDIIKSGSLPYVLMMVPQHDSWSPPEKQYALFKSLQTPKELRTVHGKGHLTLFTGDGFKELMQWQTDFILPSIPAKSNAVSSTKSSHTA